MTREEAINHLGTYKFRGINHTTAEFIPAPEVWQEAMQMAISALREQEERSKGCPYCDIAKANEWVINRALWVKESETHKWTLAGKRLTFCPMCGRRLEEV